MLRLLLTSIRLTFSISCKFHSEFTGYLPDQFIKYSSQRLNTFSAAGAYLFWSLSEF